MMNKEIRRRFGRRTNKMKNRTKVYEKEEEHTCWRKGEKWRDLLCLKGEKSKIKGKHGAQFVKQSGKQSVGKEKKTESEKDER